MEERWIGDAEEKGRSTLVQHERERGNQVATNELSSQNQGEIRQSKYRILFKPKNL